jgi:hypothetical protein
MGQYSHIANSYHIYDRHYDLVSDMLQHHFSPIELPPVKTNLIDASGRPTDDLTTLFKALENPTPDTVLIFQDTDDLSHWIYENYNNPASQTI